MTRSGHWDFGDELELTDEQRATLHERVHAGPEFRALRRRMRVFAFPMTAAFLLWYLAFVLLASYARDLMATPVFGVVNLGLVIGLGQFATTFALTAAYVRYARHRLDPLAEQIRATIEDGPGRAAPEPTAAPANPVAARVTPEEPARVGERAMIPGDDVGSVGLNLAVFGAFVLVTLVVVYRSGRTNRTASDYYAAGRAFSGPQNGVAIAGDYLSAASFLGIAGAIAVNGYDGFLYSIGFLVAWLVALLLVAELLRNTGRYTMGDVLAFRMHQRPVRAAAATATLVVSAFYLLAQMAGAGGLIALLLQIPLSDRVGQGVVIAVVGALMIVYVLVGGMKGTTYVQIIKAVLLLVCAGLLAAWVIGIFGFDLSALLERAADRSPKGEAVLAPGLQYTNPVDFVSLALALVLGTAGLPHILMRFYTVPDGREARRSVVWAIWLIGVFYLFTLVLGYGAMALLPSGALSAANQNNAAPLLAYHLGGEVLLGLVSAIAFATILAVVAGLTITASASFAHDVYANVLRRGAATPTSEVRVARLTAVVVGVVAIAGGIVANGQNVAFLVALAFAVAASANLPTILYSLFWKRFNTAGALCSIYGGLVVSVVLIVFSPAVSGKPVNPVTGRSASMLQGVDFHWFPLDNPGLVSIPASFLLGVLGTFLGGRRRADAALHAEMEVRALTGAGAERPTPPAAAPTAPAPRRPDEVRVPG